MSSKENLIWALPAVFCPCSYDNEHMRHISKKNHKINQFMIETLLESNFAKFQ